MNHKVDTVVGIGCSKHSNARDQIRSRYRDLACYMQGSSLILAAWRNKKIKSLPDPTLASEHVGRNCMFLDQLAMQYYSVNIGTNITLILLVKLKQRMQKSYCY